MVMPLYVPSRGRASNISSKSTTARYVPNLIYVVPPDEADRYRRNLENANIKDATILPCEVEGIAKVRHWIGQHAKAHGHAKFLMIDDDLNFCVRISSEKFNLRPCIKEDIQEMLAWTEGILDQHAHASISPRGNNITIEKGTRDELVQFNKRTLRYLAYRTDDFLSVKHGRVLVMEDFDVNLQLLRSGRTNVVSYWWAQDQRETGSAGGCSSYRTKQAHEEAARKLAQLHAPFVQLTMKKNKTSATKFGATMKERLEVRIAWEKAAADGGYVKAKKSKVA